MAQMEVPTTEGLLRVEQHNERVRVLRDGHVLIELSRREAWLLAEAIDAVATHD